MFCLAEVINFSVNLQPRLVFRWREVRHQLHQIGHHLLADAPHQGRPFRGELGDGAFTVIGRQESHALFGLARANVLLRVKPEERLSTGTQVEVSLID